MSLEDSRAVGKSPLGEASVGWREQKPGCNGEGEQCEEWRRRDREGHSLRRFWVEGGRLQESGLEEGWGRDPEGRGSALRWQGGEGRAPSDSLLVFFFLFGKCGILLNMVSRWGKKMETVIDFIFLGSKITVDRERSHEIKRCLLLGRKAMTNLDSVIKSRDITLPTKVHTVKLMVFPGVM